MPRQPAAFMSYVRFNDQHDDGQLTQFRERLSAEVWVQTGEEFPIFQDRNDIAWGQNWQKRIDETLDAVTLLLVIITPGFFRSRPCRVEVERFLARERELGRDDLILPVYYVDTPEMEDPARREADGLAQVLASRQYVDWRALRFKTFKSPVVRKAIAQLAIRMRDSFWRLPTDKVDNIGSAGRTIALPTEAADRATSAEAPIEPERPIQIVFPGQWEELKNIRSADAAKEAETLDRVSHPVPAATVLRRGFNKLLLLHSLQGYPANVVRILYYISLLWAVGWTATGISEIVAHFSVGYLILSIVVVILLDVPIQWGFYKLATYLDRRVQGKAHPPADKVDFGSE